MLLGFSLRYHNLGYVSFDHDEMSLVKPSKGIFTLGFPYTVFAGQIRWLATYEAVPYPLALSGWIFGYSEWSERLPACVFGTLCIGIIALMGGRFVQLAGRTVRRFRLRLHAARYTVGAKRLLPVAMSVHVDADHLVVLRGDNSSSAEPRYLTAASVAFCLTYLSWEGTGFLLPALFIALMVARPGEWWWLKQFHLYRCLFFMAVVIIAAVLLADDRRKPVSFYRLGTFDRCRPSLFFLSPDYAPEYYIDKLWLSENHVFFTIMIFLGLPFCWAQRAFRYVFTVLVMLWFLHTNLLSATAPRYCYYFQPLVILAGTAAAMTLYDRVVSLAHRAGNRRLPRCAHATGLAVITLLFLQSNESLMEEYTLSSEGDRPQVMTRMNTYKYDYRGAADYVENTSGRETGLCQVLHMCSSILPEPPAIMCWILSSARKSGIISLLSSRDSSTSLVACPWCAI